MNIPGPTPSLFYGNLTELRKTSKMPHEVIGTWLEKYGPIVGYYLGAQRYLVINDLEMLKTIFITKASLFRNRPPMSVEVKPIIYSVLALKDEAWKKVRKIISPTFSQSKVTSPSITDLIDECVENLVGTIESKTNADNRDVDIYPILQATSLDVIARTALNITTDVHTKDNNLLTSVREYFSEAQNLAVEIATLLPFISPLMCFINDNLTAGRMTDMVVKHIKNQIKETITKPFNESKSFLNSLISSFSAGNITQDELIGNAHIILLAGYETTANAVTYTLYHLAKNQDIQDKLRSYFMLEEKPEKDYFEMIWYESLRILPPVPLFLVREASQDIVINDTFIEKGTVIQVPVWQIHHNEDVWPSPYTYDPERFSPENKKSIHPMAFLTFGTGPRICLGIQLANHEARLIIRRLVTKYKIEMCDKTPDPLTFKCSTVFINPKEKVYLNFSPLEA